MRLKYKPSGWIPPILPCEVLQRPRDLNHFKWGTHELWKHFTCFTEDKTDTLFKSLHIFPPTTDDWDDCVKWCSFLNYYIIYSWFYIMHIGSLAMEIKLRTTIPLTESREDLMQIDTDLVLAWSINYSLFHYLSVFSCYVRFV